MMRGIYTLSFAVIMTVGSISIGCGNAETETEQQDSHEHATYQCPMDCETGKTYEEAGACPVCKMDLKELNQG